MSRGFQCYPIHMQVTLDIPDPIAAAISTAGRDPARAALEALAVEGYRDKSLSESDIVELLGYGTRMQVHELLKRYSVPLHYTIEDLQQDIETLRRMDREKTPTAA